MTLRAATVVVGLAIVIASGVAHAYDFPAALRELQTLRSMVRADVAFQEYQRRVWDASSLVDRYLARVPRDAKRDLVTLAMGLYVTAATAWVDSITGDVGTHDFPIGCTPAIDYILHFMEAMQASRSRSERASPELRRIMHKTSMAIQWHCASDYIADLEGSPREHWTVPPPPFIDRLGLVRFAEPAAVSPGAPDAPASSLTPEDQDRQERIIRDHFRRPYCKWVWDGKAWVAACE